MKLVVGLLIALAILVLALALIQLSHRERSDSAPMAAAVPRIEAVGFFDDKDRYGGDGPFAHLHVIVQPPKPSSGDVPVELVDVSIYGAWGHLEQSELEVPANHIQTGAGAIWTSGQTWNSGWLRSAWQKDGNEYSLLVKSQLVMWTAEGLNWSWESKVLRFSVTDRTPWIPVKAAGTPQNNGPTVVATGAFFGAQHLAMYDVTLDYAPDPGNTVTSVGVWAGPTGPTNPPSLPGPYLGSMSIPPPPAHSTFSGYYGGENTYYLQVRIALTGPTNPAPVVDTKMFSGCEASGGKLIRGR
jgi:hypothetical protein